MTVKLEKGIPLPKSRGRGRPSIYPWESMEVGDSFHAPGIKKFNSTHYGRLHKRLYITRREGDGVRVWRAE